MPGQYSNTGPAQAGCSLDSICRDLAKGGWGWLHEDGAEGLTLRLIRGVTSDSVILGVRFINWGVRLWFICA